MRETARVPEHATQMRAQGSASRIVNAALQTPGSPVPASAREPIEQRLGQSFAHVRVHTDETAARAARGLGAHAFTVGSHVFFGRGRQPAGRLLAHELAHTVQQGRHQRRDVQNLRTSAPGDVYESEADRVASSADVVEDPGAAGPMLQLQVDDPRPMRVERIERPGFLRISEWLVESLPEGGGTQTTEMYWVEFEVDADGVMRASVRTVDSSRTYRSSRLRFGREFVQALETFDRAGLRVSSFEGDWSYMTPEEISENLRVFRDELARGATREAAASRTPTGRVVTRSNFVVTSVENVAESQEHLAEQGVSRWRVRAVFRRLLPSSPGTGAGGAGAAGPRVTGGATGSTGSGTAAEAAVPPTEFRVGANFRVVNATPQANGAMLAEVEVVLGQGLEEVNQTAGANSGRSLPSRVLLRIVTDAQGRLISAESASGEAGELVQVLARQAVASVPREATAGGASAGGASAAAGAAARVSPWVRGVGWAGMVLFVGVTSYQYSQATPPQRPRVLTTAAGGFAGGALSGYIICNVVFGIETVGWSLLGCLFVAGIPGSIAGSSMSGDVFDAVAGAPIQRALQWLDTQPENVRRLFYAMVQASSSEGGLPITEDFVTHFIELVPADLAEDELATLRSRMSSIALGQDLTGVLNGLRRAISELPRRRPALRLVPSFPIMSPSPFEMRYRMDTRQFGRLRILPGITSQPTSLPPTFETGPMPPVVPLLEFDILP